MSASLASFFPRTPRQSSSSSTRPHADAPSQQLDAFGLQDFVERSSPSSAGHRPWSWLDFVVWSHAEEHDDDALLSESDTDDDEAEADDRRRGWGASSPTSLRPIPPRSLFLDFPPSIKKDNFQEGSPIIETSFGVSDGWGLTDEDVHKELVGTPANAGGSPGSVGLAKVWSYFSLRTSLSSSKFLCFFCPWSRKLITFAFVFAQKPYSGVELPPSPRDAPPLPIHFHPLPSD